MANFPEGMVLKAAMSEFPGTLSEADIIINSIATPLINGGSPISPADYRKPEMVVYLAHIISAPKANAFLG